MRDKIKSIMSKLEILIPAVLFLTMLISCGLFLNVKMNGKNSGLPSLPEKEKRLIMRSVSAESTSFEDDLIEPVFIGVKNQNVMVAVSFNDDARRSVESVIYAPLLHLFSGKSEEVKFKNDNECTNFIEEVKNNKEYILISFYTDIPSSAFLPCIVSGVDFESHVNVYNIRHIVLLPDSDENLYAYAISSDRKVYSMIPDVKTSFSKINIETYDVSDGWSHFNYPFEGEMLAEITDSVVMNRYQIHSVAQLYGKSKDIDWVKNCFDVFSINNSLVKSFSSGDNSSITYVEENNELIIDDMGYVQYTSLDNTGINLDDFLGYVPGEGANYTFSDKIFAVKKIVNSISVYNDNISYSISDFHYDDNSGILEIYFKLFCDGILLTDHPFDAVFEINGNNLVYARYTAVISTKTSESISVIPQKYANVLLRENNDDYSSLDVYCPVMFFDDKLNLNTDIKSVKWTRISSSSEVNT